MICLTATCTDMVLNDVISCLGLKNARTLKHSFNRPNLQCAFPLRHCSMFPWSSAAHLFEDVYTLSLQAECAAVFVS